MQVDKFSWKLRINKYIRHLLIIAPSLCHSPKLSPKIKITFKWCKNDMFFFLQPKNNKQSD